MTNVIVVLTLSKKDNELMSEGGERSRKFKLMAFGCIFRDNCGFRWLYINQA